MFGMIAGMSLKTALRGHWQSQIGLLFTTLRTWPWFDTLRTLRQRFREDRLGLSAGSLTFTTLIALVPLLTVMLALFTAFPVFGKFQMALQKYFLQSLVPEAIARPVLAALTQFASKASRVGGVGLLFLLASAISLMLTIDRTLNGIWRVRKPRPIGQRVLVYWAALTLGPLVLGVSLSLTSYVLSASKGLVSALPGGVRLVLALLEFLLQIGGMGALFYYVPNTHVRWRHALGGALFVGVTFELAKTGLAWYVTSVATYSAIYGAFATAPIFLLWLYLVWVIVLCGAVIAAYAPSLQMGVVRQPDVPGRAFALSLSVLRALDEVRQAGRGGLTLDALSARLRTDPLQIEPVLDTLIARDWVGRLDEGGAQRHTLLCDPATTLVAPLVDSLLLAPQDVVRTFRQRSGVETLTLAELLRS
ncbi:YihY family inner membrane protein [Ideonella sp. B7]|nr:YihY family inner membrane protein [Ideonella benzenivorans]